MELGQNWRHFQEIFLDQKHWSRTPLTKGQRGNEKGSFSSLTKTQISAKSSQRKRGLTQLKSDTETYSHAKIFLIVDGAVVLWRFSDCPQLTRELNSREILSSHHRPSFSFSGNLSGNFSSKFSGNSSEVETSKKALPSTPGYCVTVVDLQKEYPDRDIILFDRSEVESWLKQGQKCNHYFQFRENIRDSASEFCVKNKALSKSETTDLFDRNHFLIQAMGTWWAKLFPSQFGILLALSASSGENTASDLNAHKNQSLESPVRRFLIIFKRGQIESYATPDLTGFSRNPEEEKLSLIKFLSEKYGVPIQGVFTSENVWEQWTDSVDPWRMVSQSLRADQNILVPMKMSLVSLIGARGFFKVTD